MREIKSLSLQEANELPSLQQKREWIRMHNATVKLYYLASNGEIVNVCASGWWGN